MSSVTTGVLDLVLLILVSFLPALLYLAWLRQTERYATLGWGALFGAFAYGALFATIVAGVLEAVIVGLGTAVSTNYPGPEFLFLNGNSNAGALFLVLVVAPFIEEALKASGVVANRAKIRLLADGPVFGASVGLGFGFFETFLYGLGAFVVGGLAAGIALILIRSVSSVLLHGSSTGMFGYGYARSRFGVPGPGSGSYYLLAVTMHATFNALASLATILALVGITGIGLDAGAILALFAAILFAVTAIEHVRAVILSSDYPALLAGAGRYRPGTSRPPGPS
ncbi:MAG TPA: PrsW family glutamic-type intramembrane protease [Thermoplasmata archaeon]|jgi:RsiW-degrading membrane proteinase PrsW (M82 family)|nr:PrsW family glutamic-type intramembrane protease [Thermoplasmata archaeon]